MPFTHNLAVLGRLGTDRVLQVFLFLFIVAQVPYFIRGLTQDQLLIYPWVQSTLFTLPIYCHHSLALQTGQHEV